MTTNPEAMRSAASAGFINATDCADYLVAKGMPFRDAYSVTGRLVSYCMSACKTFETLELSEYKGVSELFDDDIYSAIDLDSCISRRNVPGGPSVKAVSAQIESARAFVESRGQIGY